jgi:ubiquinone/menaquinone biosynthesis C-methylase UbiE
MPDPYASIVSVDTETQAKLAGILELRASDERQREILNSYFSELELPDSTKALEVGCGSGAISRTLRQIDNVQSVVGIDPSAIFIEKAQELAAGIEGVSFQTGDARSLPFDAGTFDFVLFHTALCHIPGPEGALSEAFRVLHPGGKIAVFDGDYVTTTVAIGERDPLQNAVEMMVANFVENPWLCRGLSKMLTSSGFELVSFRGRAYTQTVNPAYMLTMIDRGADLLVASKTIGQGQGEALKAEAQRRVDDEAFFGQINFVSAIARRP